MKGSLYEDMRKFRLALGELFRVVARCALSDMRRVRSWLRRCG